MTVDRREGRSYVRPAGEVDLGTIERVRAAIDAAEPPVVLDLRAVTFLDTSGLHLVLERSLAGEGLALVRGSDAVQRLFDIAGVTDRLDFVDAPAGADGVPGG